MTIEATTTAKYETDDVHTKALAACKTKIARVRYACEQNLYRSTRDVQDWLLAYDYDSEGSNRPRVSTELNKLRERHGLPKTGEMDALTPEKLAELDAERDQSRPPLRIVGTPQETTPAGLEESHNYPVSPAPVQEVPVQGVQSPAERTAIQDVNLELNAPVQPEHPSVQAPAIKNVQADDDPADVKEVKPSWFLRIQYIGLLIGAGYGLYEVIHQVAGAPWYIAAPTAAAIELVGISVKRLADRGERHGEPRKVVRSLLAVSGLVALGIAVINGYGHSQIDYTDAGSSVVAALFFSTASILGYALWTINTALAHRATQRKRGRLEGPGIPVPAYIQARYDDAVADRIVKLTQYDETLSLDQALKMALSEIDAEERDQRERERKQGMRDGLIAQSEATHPDNPLAAKLHASQFNLDVLSDMMTADQDGHRAQAAEMRAWMNGYKTNN